MSPQTIDKLLVENQRLRQQLAEAEDTLRALRAGEVDAILVETDREQVYTLDAADKPYRLLVEQMPQAAASFTIDGIILHGNRRFASLLGRPLEMLVGKPIYEFLAADSRAPFETLLRDVQAAEVRAEVTLQRGDGTLVPAYLGINALREGPLGVCLVMTDLTEQKRYAEMQGAQKALRDADRRKNEFVAILAHELRNPLGPIRNAARILKLKGPQDPELRSPIEMIERQTEQLARLLDDLLDVSRISRGALEMRRDHVAFSDVVDASVDACHEELRDRGVHLHVSLPTEPIDLVADRARLIQVLCNLLANAGKYTPSGGKVDLTAKARDGTLVLSVKDSGIGIPPDKLTDIFDLFAQVDRSGEREGGLGIGLTLVREIATLHGGTIEARSEGIGHGSDFILTLPVVTTAAAPAKGAVSGAAAAPRRILVVDDNPDAVESLALLLQIAGHQVHKACDGEAAIALAQQVRPEVVLLDLGMPTVSGYEVAQRIREQPWGKQTFLVALSGWGQAEERVRTREAGFDAHLVKPVAPEALNKLLATTTARPRESAAS
jgi:PAS domain S-box-containing protein